MSDFAQRLREEARLIILRTLADDVAGRSNTSLLQGTLEVFGIAKTRDWVTAEVRALEDRGAVAATESGSVLVVAITQRGIDHVERRAVIDGVKRPSAPTV